LVSPVIGISHWCHHAAWLPACAAGTLASWSPPLTRPLQVLQLAAPPSSRPLPSRPALGWCPRASRAILGLWTRRRQHPMCSSPRRQRWPSRRSRLRQASRSSSRWWMTSTRSSGSACGPCRRPGVTPHMPCTPVGMVVWLAARGQDCWHVAGSAAVVERGGDSTPGPYPGGCHPIPRTPPLRQPLTRLPRAPAPSRLPACPDPPPPPSPLQELVLRGGPAPNRAVQTSPDGGPAAATAAAAAETGQHAQARGLRGRARLAENASVPAAAAAGGRQLAAAASEAPRQPCSGHGQDPPLRQPSCCGR
jgi:hypothetical protein